MIWRMLKGFGLFLGTGVVLLFGFLFFLKQLGPGSPADLPRSAAEATALSEPVSAEAGRRIEQVTIEDPDLGRIGFAVSAPDPMPDRPLPVIVLLGGLGLGVDTLRHMPPPGDNVVISYDWPIPEDLPDGLDLLWAAPGLYETVFKAPGQIDVGVAWAAAQPWADRDRVTFLTFSLGAIVAPAAQRLREARGAEVGWTVLAYGGADLGHLLKHHPEVPMDWMRPPLAWLADWLFNPIDPAEHLPHVKGRFLVIGGAEDRLIPEQSARRMRDLAPDPKTIILLEGRHVGVGRDQDGLRQRILAVTEDWLLRNRAINPR